ncbi:MAG: hypothetical protein JWM11_3077 [Planctomycetaceae bacterium]|nr:hypothetical protein [Planctomycetaceae bacterium]
MRKCQQIDYITNIFSLAIARHSGKQGKLER